MSRAAALKDHCTYHPHEWNRKPLSLRLAARENRASDGFDKEIQVSVMRVVQLIELENRCGQSAADIFYLTVG